MEGRRFESQWWSVFGVARRRLWKSWNLLEVSEMYCREAPLDV